MNVSGRRGRRVGWSRGELNKRGRGRGGEGGRMCAYKRVKGGKQGAVDLSAYHILKECMAGGNNSNEKELLKGKKQ
jgi:hypothetical protein